MYFGTTECMFQKTSVKLPKALSRREKIQSLSRATGDAWHINKLNEKLPPLKKQKSIKICQEKGDERKRNLQVVNQSWNDWKFQIHWKNLGGSNPRICIEQQKNCVSYKKLCLKENNKTAHWVGP